MDMDIPVRIAGLGRYLPERIVLSTELESKANLPAGWAERYNGVCERRWASGGETNSWMGAQAACEALAEAEIAPDRVDLIINASGTPEQAIPDTSTLIQRQLGLGSSGIACLSIHTTCLSFITALDTAASLLATRRYSTILVVSSEVASVALNPEEPETFTLFGDAAAAVVLTRAEEDESGLFEAASFRSYGDGAYLTTVMGGGTRRHPNQPTTKAVDNLFHMDGPAVLRLAHQHSFAFLEGLRRGLSTGMPGIDLVIPHQPSKMGLKLMTRFGWPDTRIVKTLPWMGNCIAASIPATLYEARSTGQMVRGDTVLLVGTGAGLSFGGLIMRY